LSPVLELKNLRTYFRSEENIVKAVDGVSYEVQQGETLALVGESGCGKSVSALSILGLIPSPPGWVESGEVIFEGRDLLKISKQELRKVRGGRIGMVFQEPMSSLNPILTIDRQITEALMLHRGMTKREARARAIELLEIVGISDAPSQLSRYPHHFSGGMRQRVMIAIALSCEPSLIIADEPTTALDVTVQAQILDLMKNLCRDNNVALMIITHNLGVVARYANRINIMYAGRIIERGTAREIFRSPSHPYTLGLLRSIPRLDGIRASKLEPIMGQPPDLAQLPVGCHFRPRCKFAVEQCAVQYPHAVDISESHNAACWVANDVKAEALT
jgi:oligopeptide/dipeptide ABC transporter ATP-binding protein